MFRERILKNLDRSQLDHGRSNDRLVKTAMSLGFHKKDKFVYFTFDSDFFILLFLCLGPLGFLFIREQFCSRRLDREDFCLVRRDAL
jgi:hypothetical protein